MGNDLTKLYQQNQVESIETHDGIHVSVHCKDREPIPYHYDDVSTVYEAFQRGQRVSNDGPFLGRRRRSHTDDAEAPYEWLSYSAVSKMATDFGAGLLNEAHLDASNDTNVGIFAQNRVEWIVSDQACVRYSMVLVPLYSTLGQEACQHVINQTEMRAIVCDVEEKVDRLLAMGDAIPGLQCVVLMEAPSSETLVQRVSERGWRLLTFEEVMASGRESPRELEPARPEDIYTICYTSGTTGVPKGVVLTHKALIITCCCGHRPLQAVNRGINPDDVALSYLPLAHIYERLTCIIFSIEGGQVAFFGGDVNKLLADIKTVRPTVFSAVPRVLNRVYDAVHTAASQSPAKKKLLDWAIESKMKDLSYGVLRTDTIWDKLVFSKVQDIFGGRLRHMSCGSAPISPDVLNFFRIALGCTIYHGYGQTETGGVSSVSAPYDFRGDHVGGPLICSMVKLVDVPDLEYYVDKGYGEICVKGYNTLREYYKMPEKTAEIIDEDGWVHTGDVGTWTFQGNLKIVDRCKQIFKLSQGEYIAPEKVEGVYQRCPHVSQVYVDGLSDKNYLVAVVVPDFDALAGTLMKKGIDAEAACKDSSVQQIILDEMIAYGRKNDLKGFEIVRRIHLHPTPFSIENGLLTATMKSKRHELRKRFIEDVKLLYALDE